jgi:hypothetical protein
VWFSDHDEQARETRSRVEVLRDAAAQLDETSNRLERLELYSQADGLRAQAQRLRLDARRMSGGGRLSPAPAGEALQPPMLFDAPNQEGRPGAAREDQQPGLDEEGNAAPPLDPVPQERQDDGELTPMPLSE